ncbi:MAG: 1-acyl-sn-glycerol-3-phosphate acyltransferase [Cyclobacteriaceae bacterium]
MDIFYSCIRFFIRISLKAYFSKIELTGLEHIPGNTPLLVAPNHQNAFLDALLVGAFIPIPLYFLTRSDVFTWWSRPILKLLHMMPVYRIRDGYSSLHQNETIFKTCGRLFSKGESVLIFAEGNHGRDYYLRPLTKGAARLAIQSQTEMDKDLMVLPVGLNYFRHTQPGTKVILSFGEPISVNPYVNTWHNNSGKGLIKMRNAISEGMKSTLIIPEITADYELRKARVFNTKNEGLNFEQLKNLDIESVDEVTDKSSWHFIPKLLNPLPFLVIWLVLKDIEDTVFHASLKFGIGLLLFPVWWGIVFATLFLTVGIFWAAGIVISIIISLFISYKW